MGARDSWYTSPHWDRAARDLFETRLSRSRTPWNTWQYLRTKANCLFLSGDHERRLAAVGLLQRSLSDLPGAEPAWHSTTHARLGQYFEAMGDPAAAEGHYRRAVDLCPLGARTIVGRSHPEEDLARLLTAAGGEEAEREAERLYDLVYDHRARQCGWRPRLADSAGVDVFGEPYTDPDEAAEAMVVYHHTEPGMEVLFHPDRAALVALDRLFTGARPRAAYAYPFLRDRFVPELGGFLGRVLVARTGGTWRVDHPVVRSRVLVGDRELDPFEAAFTAVWYERPLARLFDTLTGAS